MSKTSAAWFAVLLAAAAAHAGPPKVHVETLATGLTGPTSLAVGERVYVATLAGGDVLALPLAGGKAETIAHGLVRPGLLAVRGDYVYWVDDGAYRTDARDGSVTRRKQRGGAPEVLVQKTAIPIALADGGDAVYLAGDAGGDLEVRALDGGKPRLVIRRPHDRKLAFAATSDALYWVEGSKTLRSPHGGEPVDEVPALAGAQQLVAEGSNLVAAIDHRLVRWASSGTATLATGYFGEITAGGGWIVYTRPESRPGKADGSIEAIEIAPGVVTPIVIAHGISPLDVAIHDGDVYFTAGIGPKHGGVFRAKLPAHQGG